MMVVVWPLGCNLSSVYWNKERGWAGVSAGFLTELSGFGFRRFSVSPGSRSKDSS
jgi:hypothetical protein